MRPQTTFTLTLLGLAPAVVGALTGGFLESCNATTIKYVEYLTILPSPDVYFSITPTLSGLCEGPGGNYTNLKLNLNTCIENSNGVLLWQQNGNYDLSCGCKLDLPQLCCGCQLANGGSVDSGIGIDLDEGISGADGQLTCNVSSSASL